MPTLAEMRAELRELRKSLGHRPISKMLKGDIAKELEHLKEKRETVPPVAATHGAAPRKMAPRAEHIHESKEMEHPVKPVDHKEHKGTKKGEERKTARKAFEGETPSKKKDMMMKMMKMLEEME